MPEPAPAHWRFWSYLWRYALFAIPFGVIGMYLGMLESTGHLDLTGPEMLARIAMSGVGFVGSGLVIAFGTALTVFIVTTPARRLWAAHRAAGWTTAQCTYAYGRHRSEARSIRMAARLRELGLEPVQPRSATPPSSGPPPRGVRFSARHSATPQWTNARRPARAYVYLAILLAMFGVFSILFSPLLDRMDVQTVRCEVVSAEPKTNSGGSRGSASTASVLVETSCGPINVSRGVNFDNRDEVAASFEPGSEYDFDIGWYSRVVMKDLLRGLPTADHYRLVE